MIHAAEGKKNIDKITDSSCSGSKNLITEMQYAQLKFKNEFKSISRKTH